jgi:hypothetical protein
MIASPELLSALEAAVSDAAGAFRLGEQIRVQCCRTCRMRNVRTPAKMFKRGAPKVKAGSRGPMK